jgi:hypothetical protein
MIKLYDEELSIGDFERRFNQTVAEFMIDGHPQIVYVHNQDGDSIRCKFWNREAYKWGKDVSIPYDDFESVLSMILAGWYKTPIGTFGVSYHHIRQWRHGYHRQRVHIWPLDQYRDDIMAHILANRARGVAITAVDLHVICGGKALKRPHVSGYDLMEL